MPARNRRCSDDVVPYFSQGTSEKIHFHRLVREQPLEFTDLLTKNEFARTDLSRIALVQSVAPVVQQSSMYAQFPRKPQDVATRLHFLDSLAPKFFTVPLSLFPFHFAAPFAQSVHYKTVSFQGFTPRNLRD